MKTLIIGNGEVGKALKEIISPYHETYIRDIDPFECKDVEVLHICYPDLKDFVEITKSYIEFYHPKLTIINSSVAIGTTRRCGNDVVYSPIRGRHSENGLETEIRFFQKFVSSLDLAKAALAEEYFASCNLQVNFILNPNCLEFLKLISNVHMGLEIAWRQEVERMMDAFLLDHCSYDKWEKTYSEGMRYLGQYKLMRPLMEAWPIGGHCILPCTEILRANYPSKVLDFILESNENAEEKDRNEKAKKRV